MAPPPRQPCSAGGCTYSTPENLPTWDMVTQHLTIHQQTVHPTPAAGPPTPGTTSAPRTAKKERPTISSQMTEEQWRFFVDEWNRYKRQTKVKDQELLDELWSCMVEELRQLAFAEGGSANLQTEDAMTKKIKSLAVVSLHSSVHVVNLHEQRQQSDENVHSFAARVRGIAASCGLQKKCPGCDQTVNFSEETCYHVVMAGLCDQNTKEKALTQAMMDTIKDLDSLVKWCTAEESGRLGMPSNTIAPVRKSSYKLQHKIQSCNNCGSKRHGDGSPLAREKQCKAFGKTCAKCGRKNHFAAVCKATTPTGGTNAITAEASDEAATHNALHFLAINSSAPPEEDSTKSCATQRAFQDALTFAPSCGDSSSCFAPSLGESSSCFAPSPNGSSSFAPYPLPQFVPTTPAHLSALVQNMKDWGSNTVNTVPLPHMLHDIHRGWLKSNPSKTPNLSLTIKLHLPSYTQLGLTIPTFKRRLSNPTRSAKAASVMDTGAQMVA